MQVGESGPDFGRCSGETHSGRLSRGHSSGRQTVTTEVFLTMIDGVRRSTRGYVARCPGHTDRSPSLSIRGGDDGRILVHCFAGCTTVEICSALGLSVRDLFKNDRASRRPHLVRPARFNEGALDFRLQLHALDLRLRAELIVAAGTDLNPTAWSEGEWDQAMESIACARCRQ